LYVLLNEKTRNCVSPLLLKTLTWLMWFYNVDVKWSVILQVCMKRPVILYFGRKTQQTIFGFLVTWEVWKMCWRGSVWTKYMLDFLCFWGTFVGSGTANKLFSSLNICSDCSSFVFFDVSHVHSTHSELTQIL